MSDTHYRMLCLCFMNSLQANRERLEELVNEKNAGNVDEFVDLVHQNQIILKEMKVSKFCFLPACFCLFVFYTIHNHIPFRNIHL